MSVCHHHNWQMRRGDAKPMLETRCITTLTAFRIIYVAISSSEPERSLSFTNMKLQSLGALKQFKRFAVSGCIMSTSGNATSFFLHNREPTDTYRFLEGLVLFSTELYDSPTINTLVWNKGLLLLP